MSTVLYVTMVDPAPLAVMGEPCGHRIVRVVLTDKQAALIEPRQTGVNCGSPIREEVYPTSIQFEAESDAGEHENRGEIQEGG